MKYLAIDYNATKEIVSSRALQSADYEEGLSFAKAIKREGSEYFSHELRFSERGEGAFIVSRKFDRSKLLVFDVTDFSCFDRSYQDVITIVQKCCRVAIKMWDGIGGFTLREKHIHGSSKVVLFPLSFSVANPFRVLLDKAPDSKRQHRRGTEHFLVFWAGHGEYDQPPALANLRKAEEDSLGLSCDAFFTENSAESSDERFLLVETTTTPGKTASPFMGMEFWKTNLTQSQKNFVFSKRLGPDILKGAAGTGKTLCLVLRCIYQLESYKVSGKSLKTVLFTHSIASKEAIENLVVANGGEAFLSSSSPQFLLITTLQEWCIENLQGRIAATEYLDKDALESKNTQLLYISDAYDDFLREDFVTSKRFISKELKAFLEDQDPWSAAIYLQNEISTYIKGRAGENFEVYKGLDRASTAIPAFQEDDFNTLFHIFNGYQSKLTELNLFDSDDITISALQETSTPIWRRRRIKDGFDVLYIDETHLFNENELSLFHNLLKQDATNIVFTIDRSQAVSDCAIDAARIHSVFGTADSEERFGFGTVFRSTSEIIDLASCILASGAAIFSSMENPLVEAAGTAVAYSNDKCLPPYFIECQNRTTLLSTAFAEVDAIASRLKVKRSDVLIVPAYDDLVSEIKAWGSENSLEFISIERRGDVGAVNQAERESRYLIGGMDYIGGLEFSAVVIVGVDKDKFPPRSTASNGTSHYLRYASYTRLYVAITRAKCMVAFLYESAKGISEMLQTALDYGLIGKYPDKSDKI